MPLEKSVVIGNGIPEPRGNESGVRVKYASLMVLTVQNTLLIVLMRYVRTRSGDMFEPTTAVLCSEMLKLPTCLIIILVQQKRLSLCAKHIFENTILNPMDCLKISVPSIVYSIQNNLLFVAVSNLDPATFQVMYQLKILTTAIFSVALLGKRLSRLQWLALLLLFIGVSIVQLQQASPFSEEQHVVQSSVTAAQTAAGSVHGRTEHRMVALMAVIVACVLSGFAGVYFERVLKGTPQTIWLRNVQMGFVGILTGVITVYVKDREKIRSNGFFFGYDWLVGLVIVVHSCGGLLVAVVVKYADNILKGFATSASIVLSCITSVFLFGFIVTPQFAVGVLFVVGSIFMYGRFAIK